MQLQGPAWCGDLPTGVSRCHEGVLLSCAADVGLAKILHQQYLTNMQNVAGTFAWTAPEVLMGQRCTQKVSPRLACISAALPHAFRLLLAVFAGEPLLFAMQQHAGRPAGSQSLAPNAFKAVVSPCLMCRWTSFHLGWCCGSW